MKRINYGEVEYLVGDEAADALVRYVVLLAADDQSDVVDVHVLGPDGNAEVATFALTPATMLAAETNRSDLEEPDNSELVDYIHARTEQHLAGPPLAGAFTEEMLKSYREQFDE